MSTTPTGERVEHELPLAEILDHVIAGRRVAIIAPRRGDALDQFQLVANLASELEPVDELTRRRTNGQEQLRHASGGVLTPGNPEHFRGFELDVAYAAYPLRTSHLLEHFLPALAGTNGEIVWWES